ncbi:ALBA-Domain Protein [Trypanosoma brucei equiperdum]|uniref:ALBA-Domain Protein n=1 Tax=Trypanosoma brucei equiperdum TaxID=630700 RepID=A0A3L6KRH7_9TRYP|nr:ALBA-Domain Protein [Trypanosoma brucei equiperdum]
MSDKSGDDSRSSQVRVSVKRRNFSYVDSIKVRLSGGKPEVTISALGKAISDAVAVAEILKNQGLIDVKKITTSRGAAESDGDAVNDKIEILIAKSKDFDTIYAEQQKRKLENADKKE